MAICGHYNPPMIHSRTPECSLRSSGAAAAGSSTAPRLLLLAAPVVIDVYSLILPPQTHHTDPPACLQSCKELFICWRDGLDTRAHTHTHSRAGLVHTQTMDFLMEGPLTLFLHQEYPFHSGSIPYPFRSSHHFYSAPPISLCLSTLVYQPVSGHRHWIRSLWVNL